MKKWFLSLALGVLLSCTTQPESTTDPLDISLGSGGSVEHIDATCEEDTQRACHVTLGQNEGVISCFVGVQNCVGGEWTQCSDGEEVEKIPADDGEPLSLTTEKVCDDNPCDPRCSKWVEDGK
jgi:hypothetical protein